jgi:hypothetical protein
LTIGLLTQIKLHRAARQTQVQPPPVAPMATVNAAVPENPGAGNENLDPGWQSLTTDNLKTTEKGVEAVEDVDGSSSEGEERDDSDQPEEDEDVDCEALAEELAEQLILQCNREEQREVSHSTNEISEDDLDEGLPLEVGYEHVHEGLPLDDGYGRMDVD